MSSGGDVAEAQDLEISHRVVAVLDFGCVQIPICTMVGAVQVEYDADKIPGTILVNSGESQLRICAWSARPGQRLWEEVRSEIRADQFSVGQFAEESRGEHGAELLVSQRGPFGLTRIRITGVDGPGWMLRADYLGPAAEKPAAGIHLAECIRDPIVRADAGLPERSRLPITLPSPPKSQDGEDAVSADSSSAEGQRPGGDDAS
jgi:hypothetical protein